MYGAGNTQECIPLTGMHYWKLDPYFRSFTYITAVSDALCTRKTVSLGLGLDDTHLISL